MDALDMYQEIETLQSAEKLTTKQKQRMKELQAHLNHKHIGKEKLNRILAKGQDMKQSEVIALLESGVRKDHIYKALGMKKHVFDEYLRNIGVRLRAGRRSS